MMNNLIDRYVYDVVRRLPEKERSEVRLELEANIGDMLADSNTDEDIERVLLELGSPVELANKFRLNPRYLISPSVYDSYISTIKWAVPLVALLCLLIGLLISFVNSFQNSSGGYGVSDIVTLFTNAISGGISTGVEGGLQSLLWITLGFVIADRAGVKAGKKWSLKDLPNEVYSSKKLISKADCVVEMAAVILFGGAALMYMYGLFSISVSFIKTDTLIIEFFNSKTLRQIAPVFALALLLEFALSTVKLIKGRWNPFVCGGAIISSVVGGASMIYIFTKENLISDSFILFIQEKSANNGILNYGEISRMIVIVLCLITAAVMIGECAYALYKTFYLKD